MDSDKILQAKRLKWLCGEMRRRQDEEKDTRKFGCAVFTFQLVNEADTLAKSLGFSVPPVKCLEEKYGPEKKHQCVPPHPSFNWDGPGQFRVIFVCWTYDPFGGTAQSVATGSMIDISVGGKPYTFDVFEAMDKHDARATAAKHLTQWERALDGLIEGAPPLVQVTTTNVFHNPNIGAMHTGSGSIHKVEQNINPKLSEILNAIEQNRLFLAELDPQKQSEAKEALDNLQSEAKLPTPKINKIKSFASHALAVAKGIGGFAAFMANIVTVLQGVGVTPDEIKLLLSHFPH
jgi:hypothetical protein